MDAIATTGPTWSIEAIPTSSGVELVVKVPSRGIELALPTSRAGARDFARGVLAAAGDATERTFPQPLIPEVAHG
ncbi:hypothetical protein ACFZ8E_11620 [Methylobacterium sp. HMF5984]|uniref:hypothetical protein n=1 Tax=Methylobacterium sp. HMF5984 TaxID=3367370 RepID=UPI0038545449